MAYVLVRRARQAADDSPTDNDVHLVAVPRSAIAASLVTDHQPADIRPANTTTPITPPEDPDESVRYGGNATLRAALEEWHKLQQPFVAGQHGPVLLPLARTLPACDPDHVLIPSNALSLVTSGLGAVSAIEDRAFLARKTADEVMTGGVEPVRSWDMVRIILPAFVASHPVTGKKRIIFDGRALNNYLKEAAGSVKYEAVRDVLALQGSAATKLDLMSAFRHVQVHDSHKPLLGFVVEGRIYRYRCLPFGVSWSPALYIHLLRPVIDAIRRKYKVSLVWYVDDIIIVANSVAELDQALAAVLRELAQHGWRAAPDKTYCQAFAVIPFLGLLVDLRQDRISLRIPQSKTDDLARLVSHVLEEGKTSITVLQRIAGKLNFLRIVAPELGLYRRPLDHAVASTARCALSTTIPILARSVLAEHLAALYSICGRLPGLSVTADFIDGRQRRTAFSDASASGWGVLLLDRNGHFVRPPPDVIFDAEAHGPPVGFTVGGTFSTAECSESSAAREIRAINYGIVALDLRDCVLNWHSDATAAVGAIRKWSSPSAGVTAALIELFATVRSRNISLTVTHVLRDCSLMPVADWLSRFGWRDRQAEWSIDHDDFARLESELKLRFTADMFATADNTHVPGAFCSRFLADEGTRGDAFFVDWTGEVWWAFPPISLRRRILTRLLWYHDVFSAAASAVPSQSRPTPFTIGLLLPPLDSSHPDEPDWARLCSLRRIRVLRVWTPPRDGTRQPRRRPFFPDLRLLDNDQQPAPGPPPWPLELSVFVFEPWS
jgi:hypothetical protein